MIDLTSAARAVAVAATLAGFDTPKPIPAARPVLAEPAAAGAGLVEVQRIPIARAEAARDQAFVRRPVGLSAVEAAITADGQGDFWVRLRQDGRALAWPVSALASGARACFPSACYAVSVDGGTLAVRPEGGQEGVAAFSFDELSARLFAAAPHARLGDFVDYAAVYEPGPDPAESATFWHRDLNDDGVWVAYRTPAELQDNTWLVVIDGVYFGVKRDGNDLLFERKSQPGAAALTAPNRLRERRLPGT